MPRITPNLWFDTESEEAAEHYVSIFPNSKVTNVTRHGTRTAEDVAALRDLLQRSLDEARRILERDRG